MTRAKIEVAVLGATGLTGGELLRLLLQHPQVNEVHALSRQETGRPLHDVHPSLRHLTSATFSSLSPREAAERADVIFFALPHTQSQAFVAKMIDLDDKLLIDLSADFRLRDREAYQRHYAPHNCFELVERFVYGLPELDRETIRTAKRIANPGCFATAAELLLLPLAQAGMLHDTWPVFAITGSSGSGKTPKASTHHPFRDGNLFAYKMLAHQHETEIMQTLSQAAGHACRIRLLSHSGPMVRGIHCTTYANDAVLSGIDLAALYHNAYADHPFVHVLSEPPRLAEVVGTNFVHVALKQNGVEVEIALVLDNLVKGAAGQAVQNMNLMLGFHETAGLTHPGAYPC